MGIGGSLPLRQLDIWSLITSTYLHADIVHIGLNAMCLFAFFPVVTRQYGKAKGFVIYTAAGIAGSLLSAATGEVYSLGASGGVVGLYGAMVAYGISSDDPARWAPVKAEALWVAANFAFGLTLSDSISNAGHFGGLLGGLAAGLLIGPAKGETTAFFRSKASLTCMALVGAFLAVSLSQGAWATYLAVKDRPAYDARLAARRAVELDEMIRKSPNDAASLLARANQSYSRKDWNAALTDLDAAVSIDPTFEALYFKASSLYMLARYDEALRVYDTLVQRFEPRIPVHYFRAATQEQLGNPEDAKSDYNEIITLEPTDADEFQMRATVFGLLGKMDEALEDYNRSIELDGSIAGVHLDRGSLLATRAQYENAIADYDQALLLEPQSTRARLLRAEAFTNMSQYQKSIEDYTDAIDNGVNDSTAWNGRAWAYYKLGQQAQALADVEKSLALAPEYSAALDTRGHILEATGQRDKAIADYRAALSKDAKNTSSLEGLARLNAQ
ncbi:rhomboid family intramembrane serine protease [Agrobacterium bohemicum]